MNKLLRSLLKAGVYFLEQSDRSTADMADRVKDRVQNLSRRARHADLRARGPIQSVTRLALQLESVLV